MLIVNRWWLIDAKNTSLLHYKVLQRLYKMIYAPKVLPTAGTRLIGRSSKNPSGHVDCWKPILKRSHKEKLSANTSMSVSHNSCGAAWNKISSRPLSFSSAQSGRGRNGLTPEWNHLDLQNSTLSFLAARLIRSSLWFCLSFVFLFLFCVFMLSFSSISQALGLTILN